VRRPAKKTRYHHGDLRAALIDTTVELIAERGIGGFSLAEASRRLGVTVSAPYRHFADRDELLVAAATRAAEAMSRELDPERYEREPPADRLAAAARGYVRFAAEQRPLFETLFAAGLQKDRYPELVRAAQPVQDAFGAPALALCPKPADAEALAMAVVAVAHGYATLLLDMAPGPAPTVAEAADRAGHATLALVAGRTALLG
jgi:AcrR family transcriptional regulator